MAVPAAAGRLAQITVPAGHVDNPARSVKFGRLPRRPKKKHARLKGERNGDCGTADSGDTGVRREKLA